MNSPAFDRIVRECIEAGENRTSDARYRLWSVVRDRAAEQKRPFLLSVLRKNMVFSGLGDPVSDLIAEGCLVPLSKRRVVNGQLVEAMYTYIPGV